MELIDRYLQAVKFWLPKEQKQDIIAELSEDLRSRIEEEETELQRKLNESEVEAILKQLGRPVLVANRYLPREHLIGPVLFPIYKFVLKIAVPGYLGPWLLAWIGTMSFNPAYRAEHSQRGLIGIIGSVWGPLWTTAFVVIGVVTIVFAVLERVQAKSGILEDWNPRKLPPVRDPNQIPPSGSIIELVVGVLFTGWWISAMRSPVILDRSTVQITLAPVWRDFFWSFLCLSLVNVAMSSVNVFRPYWTRRRAGIRLLTDCVGAALLCWLCKSDILASIIVQNVVPAKTLAITNAINMWMGRSFPVAVGFGIVIAGYDVYRILRVEPSDSQLTPGVAATAL
jgi:hypothetical protein